MSGPDLETAAATWREWFARGEFDAGRAAMESALDAPGADAPTPVRVRVLYAAGMFAFRQGDQTGSRRHNEEALEHARALGDVRGECDALTGLARVALRDGDYAGVVELASRARTLARGEGDRSAEARPLHLHAAGVRLTGDYDEARRLYLESLDLNTELGNESWQAMELHNLGWVELHRGDLDAAAERFAAREARGAEDDAYGAAWLELNRAGLALARAERETAAALFEEGKARLEALGAALDPDDRFELDWLSRELEPA
jgi:tetratricopeptide (TPR) repeat protein